jgi:hypothetical protein
MQILLVSGELNSACANYAVTLGEGALVSFPFNRCLEQSDNIAVIKYKCGTAHFAGQQRVLAKSRLFTFCQCKRPCEVSRNSGDIVQRGKTSLTARFFPSLW